MSKNIVGSVGRGGRNFPPADVMTVQYLLNCVPASQGGPPPELAVDGAAGPKTIAAIEKFQRTKGGFADGRVDPGGNTLRALQAHDPYPNQPLPQGGAKGSGNPFGQKSVDGQKSGQDPFGNKVGSGQNAGPGPCGQTSGFSQKSSQQFGNKGFGPPGVKSGGPSGGGGILPGSKNVVDQSGGKGGGKGF